MLERYQVMDCRISRVGMRDALRAVRERAQTGLGGYVCFSNVHTVVTASRNPAMREITNRSFMSMPDGKPIAAIATLLGVSGVERVAGPDFMWEFLSQTRASRHYFFGSTSQTLSRLVARLERELPGLNVVGAVSPPFEAVSEAEAARALQRIGASSPDYVWVGLGAPKQELWMARNWEALRPAMLFGVGAAFDFHAGTRRRAPSWMQRAGLEWLHRLSSEPFRLWRRYLHTNAVFLVHVAKTLGRSRRSASERRP